MSLNPVFQTEGYKKLIVSLGAQSIVECRFSQVDDVNEIIAVYPQVAVSGCEVASGRVNYGGRLICTVVYTDDGGKLCRMQKGAEFSHYADCDLLAPAQTGLCALKCERSQIKRDGSSYVISVVVGAEIRAFGNAERTFLTGADGAVCRTENVKFYSAVTFSGESEIEDDFECDSVADVLVPGAEVLVTDCECRSGEVAVTGEIYLSLLTTRGGSAAALERTVPFKASIPCENALLSQRAACRAEIRDVNVTAKVNEERGKCEINLLATLGIDGVFYEETEVPAATDAFCPANETEISFGEESASPCDGVKVYAERVSGLCATRNKLDYTCNFKAVALPRAEFSFRRESHTLEGAVTAVLVYEQGGEQRSSEVSLPFTVSPSGLFEEEDPAITVVACGVSVRQRSEGECEAEAVLKISVFGRKEKRSAYITKLTEGKPVKESDAAISVIIPAAGDELWDIAKKLRRAPKAVSECNPELTFPLKGDERILVYRMKNA